MATCKHCNHTWEYRGKNTVTNCPRCGYKVFNIKTNTTEKERFDKIKHEIQIQPNGRRILIIPISDIHVGAPFNECLINVLENFLTFIRKKPNVYMLGLGDYGDWAQKMQQPSRGPNLRLESLSPNMQFEKLYGLFKPLADEGKILGLCSGNHDMWVYEYGGFDIVRELTRDLNIPYLASPCTLTLKLGAQVYTLYVMHGVSNAKTASGKIAALQRMTKDIFADIFLMGHTHAKAAIEGGKYFYGQKRKCYYCLTGNFLDWEGSYAQIWGDVSPSGVVRIELYTGKTEFVAREWDYHVSL